MPPVLQEPGGFRGHLPVVGVRQAMPRLNERASLVDDLGRVVLLHLVGDAVAAVGQQDLLALASFPPLRLRDRRDEVSAAAGRENVLGRLTRLVELPVLGRALIGRVQDRPLEERLDCRQRLGGAHGQQSTRGRGPETSIRSHMADGSLPRPGQEYTARTRLEDDNPAMTSVFISYRPTSNISESKRNGGAPVSDA